MQWYYHRYANKEGPDVPLLFPRFFNGSSKYDKNEETEGTRFDCHCYGLAGKGNEHVIGSENDM